MKLRALPFLWCSLAMFVGGCPKRQAPTRIVYIPSPTPTATQASAAGTPTMVIEEPAPPEPPAPPPPAESTPKPTRPRRHVLRTEPPAAPTDSAPDTPEPQPPPQVPSLEPLASAAEQAALRSQVLGVQDDVRRRIDKLGRAKLTGAERKTLDDAQTFLTQSTQALNEADLQRALTLAQKASLLVSALER